tara:strand:+ start:292 stop:558 length:267 start_codon:yes stop_codon:yes gene_type:complete
MGFIEVLVITFVAILIISIVISSRNYKRLIESQMEDIKRRQLEVAMRVDRATEEAERIRRWADPNFGLTTDEEKKIEPTKHIKRHSIR